MPRRKAAVKREVLPDPLYGSELLAHFINFVMRDGKKALAERIVYGALKQAVAVINKKGARDDGKSDDANAGAGVIGGALEVFGKALDNIRPAVEVKSRRVGGATYQVPTEVAPRRGTALAMRWLVNIAKKRGEKTIALRLAAEIVEAYYEKGAAVKMRDDMYRMAKANQAFAHFRW